MLATIQQDTSVRDRHWWTCDRCGARLGEVVSPSAGHLSLIVAHGYRTWVVAVTEAGVMARCKCGCENTLEAEHRPIEYPA